MKKIEDPQLKELIEFVCVCAIIGGISAFTWSDNMVKNIIVMIVSALVLAIIRVTFMFIKH